MLVGNVDSKPYIFSGRAGYRRAEPLRTIPQGVTSTTGEGGATVPIVANYFRVITPTDRVVHDYRVDIEPNVEAVRTRRTLIRNLAEHFQRAFIFDGSYNLKSSVLLPEMQNNVREFMGEVDGTQYRIIIRHSQEIAWGHAEMLRLFNTHIRNCLRHLGYSLIGRNFYNPNSTRDIPQHRLTLWKGVVTAINEHDQGLMMVCDTTFRVVRSDMALDVLKEIHRRNQGNSEGFQEQARQELESQIVMTKYNNRTYKILDIDFTQNPTNTFPTRDGRDITYIDYYQNHYNYTIRDHRQPLLLGLPSGTPKPLIEERKVFLIPELCTMTGLSPSLQDSMDVRRALTQNTQATPVERVQHLTEFMRGLSQNSEVRQELGRWNYRYDLNLVNLPGRRLDCEKILMQGDQFDRQSGANFVQRAGDFSKEIRGKKMWVPANLKRWAIIFSHRDGQLVRDFQQTMTRVCGPMGIELGNPRTLEVPNDRASAYVEACRQFVGAELIVCIVPNNDKNRYEAIKKLLCIDQPCPSQVIVGRTISKKQMLMSVCTKISIQMACKIGAEAWAIHIPVRRFKKN